MRATQSEDEIVLPIPDATMLEAPIKSHAATAMMTFKSDGGTEALPPPIVAAEEVVNGAAHQASDSATEDEAPTHDSEIKNAVEVMVENVVTAVLSPGTARPPKGPPRNRLKAAGAVVKDALKEKRKRALTHGEGADAAAADLRLPEGPVHRRRRRTQQSWRVQCLAARVQIVIDLVPTFRRGALTPEQQIALERAHACLRDALDAVNANGSEEAMTKADELIEWTRNVVLTFSQ